MRARRAKTPLHRSARSPPRPCAAAQQQIDGGSRVFPPAPPTAIDAIDNGVNPWDTGDTPPRYNVKTDLSSRVGNLNPRRAAASALEPERGRAPSLLPGVEKPSLRWSLPASSLLPKVERAGAAGDVRQAVSEGAVTEMRNASGTLRLKRVAPPGGGADRGGVHGGPGLLRQSVAAGQTVRPAPPNPRTPAPQPRRTRAQLQVRVASPRFRRAGSWCRPWRRATPSTRAARSSSSRASAPGRRGSERPGPPPASRSLASRADENGVATARCCAAPGRAGPPLRARG